MNQKRSIEVSTSPVRSRARISMRPAAIQRVTR